MDVTAVNQRKQPIDFIRGFMKFNTFIQAKLAEASSVRIKKLIVET